MQLNRNGVVVIALVAAGLAFGAYKLGLQHGQSSPAPVPAPAPAPSTASSGQTAAPAAPAGHPPAASGERTGFTQFRVGNRNVKAMFVDGKDVWVGTSGGLIRYDTVTDKYRLYDIKSGLLSKGIFSIGKLNGRIIVGTYGGGMSLYNAANDTWETYNIPEGLADAFVYGVLQLPNGDVWIATWSGANRIRGGNLKDHSKWDTFTVANTHGGLPNDWVYGLAKGKNGEVWMATEGGLGRYKDGKWSHWNHASGLGAPFDKVSKNIDFKDDPGKMSAHHAHQKIEQGLQGIQVAYNPNYIVALAVDKSGAVWCGTWGGGLSRFDGKHWRTYTVADGLPGNHVFMLHEDQKGRLWVGTNNGLALMQGDKFKVLNTANGLYSNVVFSMASGDDGSLWVGSYGGVSHLTGY